MSRPDMTCPYCGAEIDIDAGDFNIEQDSKHQYECETCGKTFLFTAEISVDYYPEKADCLNGSPHDWKFASVECVGYTAMRCRVCGETRPLTPEEVKERLL